LAVAANQVFTNAPKSVGGPIGSSARDLIVGPTSS
jgi:hypothetical protein